MAKYINFDKAQQLIGEDNMSLLVGLGVCKKGNGSALNLSKDGKWVPAPLVNSDKIFSYLSKRLPKHAVKEVEVVKEVYEFTHKLVKGDKPLNWVSKRYSEVFFSLDEKETNIWDVRVPMVLDQKNGGRPKSLSIGCWADLAPQYYNISSAEAVRVFAKLSEVLKKKVPSKDVVIHVEDNILRERVMKTIVYFNDPVVAK